MNELKLDTAYKSSFDNERNLDLNFNNLKTVIVKQLFLYSENKLLDSKYLRYILSNLRKSSNIESIVFGFSVKSINDAMPKTLKYISLGYMLYNSKLIELKLIFNDLMKHHKVSIWRTIELNSRTLKIVQLYLFKQHAPLLPMLNNRSKIVLNELYLAEMKTTDFFLLGKSRKNFTFRKIFGNLRRERKMLPDIKYFLGMVMKHGIKCQFGDKETLALSKWYAEIGSFLETHK